jgi:hypothetical protein
MLIRAYKCLIMNHALRYCHRPPTSICLTDACACVLAWNADSKHPSGDKPMIDLLGMSCSSYLVRAWGTIPVTSKKGVILIKEGEVVCMYSQINLTLVWRFTLSAMWDCNLKAGRTPEIEHSDDYMTYFAHRLPMFVQGDFLN